MEFRLLGSLDVAEGDRSLPLGGGKQRALLADPAVARERRGAGRAADRRPVGRVAAGHGGQERAGLRVAAAQAAGGRAPGDAAAGLRAAGRSVGARRRALRAARDAGARGATPEMAAARLREALALWRGPPLADLAVRAVRAGRDRAAGGAAAGARSSSGSTRDLATGRHAELVGELEALVAEHPLRERLRGQLMLALYRSGRQAEALEAYRRAAHVRWSRSSASSRAGGCSELARGDPAPGPASLDAGRRAPRRRPARPRRPVGGGVRAAASDELAALDGGARRRVAGRAGAAVVPARAASPGSARAGSPRSCSRTRARARRARARRPLLGGGRRAGVLAVGAVAARVRPRDSDPDALRDRARRRRGDLAQAAARAARARPRPARARRRRTTRARASASSRPRAASPAAAARGRPLVLVLDDLHAADEPSLLLLRFLAREIADSRLLVVVRVPRRRPDAAARR